MNRIEREIALLWHGRIKVGDKIEVPGEVGKWIVRKIKQDKKDPEGFSAILVRSAP